MRGFWKHLATTLILNCRNPQALIMGYAMPVFFLVAFGIMMGTDIPGLTKSMGRLLTISALGGACFGLPIAMVSERDRGVWRRYRLTPLGSGWFVLGAVLARYLLISSSALLQYGLAMIFYKVPFPVHPFELLLAFTCASFAFIGIGLIIASVANSIGSVQALGQSLFLPMILIGGVGVPIHILPPWARDVSLFLPGRWAADTIRNTLVADGLERSHFNVLALVVIGAAAIAVGWKLFRWESSARLEPRAIWWILLAVAVWIMVGAAAEAFHLAPAM
jgi:ABC-2 type transport system permease protein